MTEPRATPQVIHRLWLGPGPMPADYQRFGQDWAELNPGWEVWEWTNIDVETTVWNNEVVLEDIRERGGDSVEAAVQMADVLGYEIIYEYGGLYVNVDIEPLKPMSYFYSYYKPRNTAYAGREDWNTDRIVNSVLGGPRRHPFWGHVLDQLPYRYWENPEAEMVTTTGPVLLTDCAKEWRTQNPEDGFTEIARAAFNAVHWSQIPLGEDAAGRWIESEEMIGIHHWGHRKQQRTNLVGKPVS